MKKCVLVLLAIGCVLALSSAAYAGGNKWTFPNNEGTEVNDLHIEFKHGCTYDNTSGVSTPFLTDDGTAGSSADHDLTNPSGGNIADGGSAVARFVTSGTGPAIKSWYWTLDGVQVGDVKSGAPNARANIRATAGADGDCNEVTISYDGATSRVRAFALDITVDQGATIGGIVSGSYKVGESVDGSKGYGIFMGSIVIDGNELSGTYGDVLDDGSPIAPADDPCNAGQIGDSAITVELGSLYVNADGDANSPDYSDTLLKFWVSGDCNVVITENAIRGGVVMEEPGQNIDPNLTGCEVVCAVPEPPTCWDLIECVGQPNGDADCDGNINLNDLSALKGTWGKSCGEVGYNCCADFTQDGIVNLNDLSALKAGWGSTGLTPSTGVQDCPACP